MEKNIYAFRRKPTDKEVKNFYNKWIMFDKNNSAALSCYTSIIGDMALKGAVNFDRAIAATEKELGIKLPYEVKRYFKNN